MNNRERERESASDSFETSHVTRSKRSLVQAPIYRTIDRRRGIIRSIILSTTHSVEL